MPLTQQQIAQQLGVSRSLVSRALRGTAGAIGASRATIDRIQRAAARLGYRPSAVALSLRGERTRTLGIAVKDFDDPYFGRLIGELQRAAAAAEYSLVLTGCRRTDQLDAGALLKYRLDGLIVAGSEFEPAGLEAFTDLGLPVAQIGTGEPRRGVLRVAMDQEHGLKQLLHYVRGLGHCEIGYIGDGTPASRRREATLANLVQAAGLRFDPARFVNATRPGPQAGYEAMRRLLAACRDNLPTVVTAADDVLAQSALRILFERGWRVPQDISLTGVDDVPAARMTIPALTTIRQPMDRLARAAFAWVTATAEKRRRRRCWEILVRPELVVRESCGKARGNVIEPK